MRIKFSNIGVIGLALALGLGGCAQAQTQPTTVVEVVTIVTDNPVGEDEINLADFAANQATHYDGIVEGIGNDLSALAARVAEVYSNPGSYTGSLPLGDENADMIAQFHLPTGIERVGDIAAEEDLLTHVLPEMQQLIADHPEISSVYFGSESGILFVYMRPFTVDPEYVPSERPWYEAAVGANGNLVWTHVYVDSFTGGKVATAAQEVRTTDGTLVGVVGADITLDAIIQDLNALQVPETGFAFLTDAYGDVFADSRFPSGDAFTPDDLDPDLISAMRGGQSGMREINHENIDFTVGYAPLSTTGWALGVGVRTDGQGPQ